MAERESVPNGLGPSIPGPEPVALTSLPLRGKLVLRAGPDVVGRVEGVLGMALPTVPLTSAGRADRTALWLGPDEWLLLVPPEQTAEVAEAIRRALDGTFHAIVDVTERFAGFALGGPRAGDVLAAGCPVDLRPRVFTSGTVVRTLLGKVEVILWSPSAQDGFMLLVGRSFAEYTGRFLTNAALEYGVLSTSDV